MNITTWQIYTTIEAVELIRTSNFYFKRYDLETGEQRLSKTFWVRVLNIVNIIASSNKEGFTHFSKHKTFRDSIHDYTMLNDALDCLKNLGIITIIENKFGAAEYILNKQYEGECNIKLNKREQNILTTIHKRPSKRGKKATTSHKIRINITYSEFQNKMLAIGKDYETINEQWKFIKKINSTNTINPRMKRDSRLYSDFTNLSKIVHDYITIDDENLIELDQHATYFTLLPSALSRFHTFLSDEQENCIKNLRTFITNSDNIYETISDETGLNKTIVKELVNSFICDTTSHMSGNKSIIQSWFFSKFPYCSGLINQYRKNKRLISMLNKLESDIFITTARRLIKKNVQIITKHDCILCKKDDAELVNEMLEARFVFHNVCAKLKRTNRTGQNKDYGHIKKEGGRRTILCEFLDHISVNLSEPEFQGFKYWRFRNKDGILTRSQANTSKSEFLTLIQARLS